MPTLAIVDGVMMQISDGGHPPPHAHAEISGDVAQIAIAPVPVMRGRLPPSKHAASAGLGGNSSCGPDGAMVCCSRNAKAWETTMSRVLRIVAAGPALYGALKITREDTHTALADLQPVLCDGDVFGFPRNAPEMFDDVRIDDAGRRVFWIDGDGDEIDFGSESLRKRADSQATILQLAS